MGFDVLVSIIAIFVLIGLSAFFSASETAFTATSRVRMYGYEKEGNKRAKIVNKIREKKDRMIGALLLGNNFVNILASAIATSALIKMFGDEGVVYATVVMTALILIFAEVMPKTYALHRADPTALKLAPLVRLVVTLFAPLTQAVAWIVRLFLRMMGVDISKVTPGSHLELLRGAIELHKGPSQETKQQRAMLRSILDLYDVEVGDIMVHRQNVTMIDANQSIRAIVEQVLDTPYSRLPVWKDDPDNIEGIIHVRLLFKELNRVGGDVSRVDLAEIMMEARYIPDSTTLHDQLQVFREKKEHFAIVVDEYGTFMGIVTLEDILEEIVGEIDDEHDENVQGVRKMHGGSFMVRGTVTIRDLNRDFDWGLPVDSDYSTVAGLILYESREVPDVGQSFMFHGFRFDIVRRLRNQITMVRVTPLKNLKKSA